MLLCSICSIILWVKACAVQCIFLSYSTNSHLLSATLFSCRRLTATSWDNHVSLLPASSVWPSCCCIRIGIRSWSFWERSLSKKKQNQRTHITTQQSNLLFALQFSYIQGMILGSECPFSEIKLLLRHVSVQLWDTFFSFWHKFWWGHVYLLH